nr:transglycosylase domain-containing protein [uncultured Rhodopila sp.]
MLLLLPALAGAALLIAIGVPLAGLAGCVAFTGSATLLGAALTAAGILLAIRLAWAARWPALVAGAVLPIGIVAVIAACLGWGWLHRERNAGELRREAARHRAILLTDPAGGGPSAAVPAGLLTATARPPAYLAVAPAVVPPVWWACAVWLEDRGLDEPWHLTGVDVGGVMRAYAAGLRSRREGGSTISEMIARELLELRPRPSAPVWEELPRKLVSWSYGPAVQKLFPDDAHLALAAATHLPLVIGGRGSGFGPELHGLVRAAGAVFGKPPEQMDAAEAAVLAAAIKLPVVMAAPGSDPGAAAAERRFGLIRARADRCLANAPLPPETDRVAARAALRALPVPGLKRAGRPPVPPATLFGLPGALLQAAGPDWRNRVASVRAPRLPADFAAAFAAAVHDIERRAGPALEVPLWDGPDHALVLAAVANARGEVILEFGNEGAALATTGAYPIASLGKIAAAITLGPRDRPGSLYHDPQGHTVTAREAFARSLGPPILNRLAQRPDAEAAAVFAALGWPVPPPGEARYNAVYGAIEVRPDAVLRAAGALTGILADRMRQLRCRMRSPPSRWTTGPWCNRMKRRCRSRRWPR